MCNLFVLLLVGFILGCVAVAGLWMVWIKFHPESFDNKPQYVALVSGGLAWVIMILTLTIGHLLCQ